MWVHIRVSLISCILQGHIGRCRYPRGCRSSITIAVSPCPASVHVEAWPLPAVLSFPSDQPALSYPFTLILNIWPSHHICSVRLGIVKCFTGCRIYLKHEARHIVGVNKVHGNWMDGSFDGWVGEWWVGEWIEE